MPVSRNPFLTPTISSVVASYPTKRNTTRSPPTKKGRKSNSSVLKKRDPNQLTLTQMYSINEEPVEDNDEYSSNGMPDASDIASPDNICSGANLR